MYSINGISLHDHLRGWRILREGTNTQGGITNSLNKIPYPGRPGYSPAPYTFGEQIVVFNVRCTLAGLEPLLALCGAADTLSRTDDPTKEARVMLASAIPSSDAPLDSMHDVTITVSLYDGVWRDVDIVTEGPLAITSPTHTFDVFDGMSAPIFNMDIFMRGDFGQFQITDSAGSVLRTTQAWSGLSTTGILWVGETGQAFLANESSPWVPVSDVSQYVDVSGNGGFQITPHLVSGNPADRTGRLSVTTLSQTSTTLRVRARRSYRTN